MALAILLWLIPSGMSRAQSFVEQNPDNNLEVSATGYTRIVSVSSNGNQGNSNSNSPAISANGKLVAFSSGASNLVTNDTNSKEDIFLRNLGSGKTTIISTSSTGVKGNGLSWYPSISADGRFIAFESFASNLVGNDTNSTWDVFVKDTSTGKTSIVSVSSTGVRGNSFSGWASISADGRFVAFYSSASNLVNGDTNGYEDVFVHDRQTKTTTRVSVSSQGEQGNKDSSMPSISADGRFVAFHSKAFNLVDGDTNSTSDIFIHDRETGETTRVSVSSLGGEGDSNSYYPSINADGQIVAFYSGASNLVMDDTNEYEDVFIHDRLTGETTLVSKSSEGEQGNYHSNLPSISADGNMVAFESSASNLVSVDTNDTNDIFIHNRQTGETTRVSVSSLGVEGNNYSGVKSISADGNLVVFGSAASNLIDGDWNNYGDVFLRLIEVHSISGTIMREDLTGWGGVTISLLDGNGETVSSVINELDGTYTIPDTAPGTYMVKPERSGYTFTPSSRSVSVPPDATGMDFIAVPIGHSPANEEKLTSSKVTFSWDAFPNAIGYKLQLSTNLEFTALVLNIKVTEPTFFYDSFLKYNQEYYWWVKPIYEDHVDLWQGPWYFTSMDPLVKPVLTYPAHKQIMDSSDVTLAWEPIENATQYKVVIAKDALFQSKVTSLKTANATAPFNLPDGKYFWRVRALDPYGAKSPWSDYRIFKVDAE